VFRQRMPTPEHTDLIDLLLNTEPEMRKLVIFEALKAGELAAHEVESLVGMVGRLERAATPRQRSETLAVETHAA
jgi:hypothetical protein